MILLKDTIVQEIIHFLEHCEGTCTCSHCTGIIDYDTYEGVLQCSVHVCHVGEMQMHHVMYSVQYPSLQCTQFLLYPPLLSAYGRSIPCRAEQPLGEHTLDAGRNTVTFEARLVKSLFLRLTWI